MGTTTARFPLDEADGTGPILASSITSELHGGCLTTEDLDRIQGLVNEFCLKSLLPHMERQMRLLNESVSLMLIKCKFVTREGMIYTYLGHFRPHRGKVLIDRC